MCSIKWAQVNFDRDEVDKFFFLYGNILKKEWLIFIIVIKKLMCLNLVNLNKNNF
jgi:hypothetical protein